MEMHVGVAKKRWCTICLEDGGLYNRAVLRLTVDQLGPDGGSIDCCTSCFLAEVIFWENAEPPASG